MLHLCAADLLCALDSQVTHTESVSDDKEAEPGIVHPFARSASLSSMVRPGCSRLTRELTQPITEKGARR